MKSLLPLKLKLKRIIICQKFNFNPSLSSEVALVALVLKTLAFVFLLHVVCHGALGSAGKVTDITLVGLEV